MRSSQTLFFIPLLLATACYDGVSDSNDLDENAASGAAASDEGLGHSNEATGGDEVGGDEGESEGAGEGEGEGGESGTSDTSDPLEFEAAPGMLRRLTRTQFRNAVRDVLGAEVDVNDLDAESWNGDFAAIGASSVVTSERGVEQYHAAIESAVEAVFADVPRRDAFIGCTPTSEAGDACVRGFIEKIGRRTWRRPPLPDEVDRIIAIAENASTQLADPVEGVRWATVALLVSPNFLYRPELGTPMPDGSLRITGYEMASRLSFLLWNSLPDDRLLDEAASGTLDTPEGVLAAAERMLDEPPGREAIGAFAEEYMRLDRVALIAKDPSLFPEYGPSLQAAMIRDMRAVWESIAFDDQASALDLFTTAKVVVNSDLATLYGLDATGLDTTTFEERSLPAGSPRAGILGKAAFLAQFANQKEGSPTLRGKFIRQSLMCQTVPPPPPDVTTEFEETADDVRRTKRDKLALHRSDARCAGCHALMDPLGLPLETFDAIGRYRTTEAGLAIDPSGDFEGQAVADALGLTTAMSESPTVARCVALKYYTYAVGHEQRKVDAIVVDQLAASFTDSGFKLRELVLDVVSHEAFSSVAPQL